MYEQIKVNHLHDGQVTEIVLGPPPGNILTTELMREVAGELLRLNDDRTARRQKLIIFRGDGEHFSYGSSVEEHKVGAAREMLLQFHGLIGQVLECSVPTVAQVSGLCLGGGLELALTCSLIFSSADAEFGVPEIRLGVFPPAASVLLPAKTTHSAACEMILTGERHSAADMHRIGLVNRVATTEPLEDLVGRFVEKEILSKSASTLRLAHQATRVGVARHFHAHIRQVERLYLNRLMSTRDAAEGVNAFLEKRTPEWTDE